MALKTNAVALPVSPAANAPSKLEQLSKQVFINGTSVKVPSARLESTGNKLEGELKVTSSAAGRNAKFSVDSISVYEESGKLVGTMAMPLSTSSQTSVSMNNGKTTSTMTETFPFELGVPGGLTPGMRHAYVVGLGHGMFVRSDLF